MLPNTNTLIKFITQQCSAEEKKHTEKWLNENANNLSYFKKLKAFWFAIDYQCDYKPDQSKAWENIINSVKEKEFIVSNRSQYSRLYKIAAILLISFFLGVVYLMYIDKSDQAKLAGDIVTVSQNPKTPIQLADGSKVWLKKGSTLSYTSGFKENRKVTLKGEAYFDVINQSNAPFSINTETFLIRVIGTKFSIRTSDGFEAVYLDEGKVEVENHDRAFQLETGNRLSMIDGRYTVDQYNLVNNLGYITGDLFYDTTPMYLVIKELEELYSVNFIVENEKILNCRLTATFKNKSLTEIVRIIDQILPSKFAMKDDQSITISGKGC